jgi:DNA-binding NtrC family response regulator
MSGDPTGVREPARLLLADDDASLRRSLQYHLEKAGYAVDLAADGAAALRCCEAEPPDLLVADLRMPGLDGLDLVSGARALDPTLVVIVITAHGDVASAVEAMRRGAFDFLQKPFPREALLRAVEKGLELRSLQAENAYLRGLALERHRFESVIAAAPVMHALLERAARVAASLATVLLLGETGTGKEVLARAIHFASPRREAAFVPLNLAAIPAGLVESELFGHVKGAYTGAGALRKGAFEEAAGGTLFLDEVGELAGETQVKLLRVLQEREYSRLGETRRRAADVRVIAATHRDLEAAVAKGAFREDLYYRLCVVPLRIPPLRERREDIPLLASHFLEKAAARLGTPRPRLTQEAAERLCRHPYPGNVRELENIIERAVVLDDDGCLDAEDLSFLATAGRADLAGVRLEIPAEGISLEAVERALITEALSRCDYVQARAARFLGITRNTLLYRMEKHGIQKHAEG